MASLRAPAVWRATAAALVALASISATSGDARTLPEPDRGEPAFVARIDAFLKSELVDAGIPGMAVAIVADGRVVHVGGYGVADGNGRLVTPDTPFLLASVTKSFTAAAVMQLVEAGNVDLDAPVVQYLPWLSIGDDRTTARITIRHLLEHTSGIRGALGTLPSLDDGDDPAALERRIRRLADRDPTLTLPDPGSRHEYENANYEILGLVVETVSGLPFDEYIAARIYEPLGMTHSHVLARDALDDGAAEGFYRWFGLWTAPHRTPFPRATGPAGVSFSSANDMAKWALFQLGDGVRSDVLGATSLRAMHERAIQYDERHWYGMGWVIRPLWEELDDPPDDGPITEPAADLVEHGGVWETAHVYMGIVPERDWGVVLMANINDQTIQTRYFYTELGLLNLMAGGEPIAPVLSEPLLIRYGKQVVLFLFLAQVASILWTLRTVAAARRERVAGVVTLGLVLTLALALAVDLFVLYLLFVYAPDYFGADLLEIAQTAPDLGPILVASAFLAVLGAIVRTPTVLLARRLGTRARG